MYNYSNLSDYEFEILCKDIMQKKLQKELYIFPKGRDGGIDITEDPYVHSVIIQVKHYSNSKYSNLLRSLKDEVAKLRLLRPKRYYICCSLNLTPKNKSEIYEMFSVYMASADDIIALQDINEFLDNDSNAEIIRKHYKLWLESTNVLNEIFNQNVFVDCESLLYNIDKDQKEFVATNCYKECIEILGRDRILLLLGMPGTGKTMTTKMLALFYAAKGYRIRYTTNGDLTDLKNALSTDKNQKEIVLLDDCLGQHYFKMKESQQNELLSLIKYIAMNRNKKLIMNSRVTIFQEAKERSVEFKQFAEDECFQIKILDMGKISVADKGRIFHNHIYFKKLPKEYYLDICRDKNYCKIVKHKNYTPRIMEFVTRKVNYEKVLGNEYFTYVKRCLDNPTEIWNDEFTKKLQPEDRIFLTTLYSLTETNIEESILRRGFNYRLKNTINVDTTNNVWKDVIRRLEGAFIVIGEWFGKKKIGVINPSVNDFLKKYLDENQLECENIKKYATESVQILRGFSKNIKDLMVSGEILEFNFENNQQRMYIIANYICQFKIFKIQYKEIVEKFLENMPYGYISKMTNYCELFVELLTDEFDEFYATRQYMNKDKIQNILQKLSLYDYEKIINAIDSLGDAFIYQKYREIFMDSLHNEIEKFIDDIDLFDYYDDEVEIMIEKRRSASENTYVGSRNVEESVRKYMDEIVKDEIKSRLYKLPDEMKDEIDNILLELYLPKSVVEEFVDGILQKDEEDSDFSQNEDDENNEKILDCIFR